MRPMQWINLLRLAADPKVTRVPVRVLAALRRAGKRRLPEKVDREVAAGIPGLRTLRYAARWLDAPQPPMGAQLLSAPLPVPGVRADV